LGRIISLGSKLDKELFNSILKVWSSIGPIEKLDYQSFKNSWSYKYVWTKWKDKLKTEIKYF
jgi:hypothetical protein